MLPEKPWKAEAIMRLIGSVLICVFMGGLAVAVAGCLGRSQKAIPVAFLALSAGAFALFAGALFILARPWRFENVAGNFGRLVAFFYGGFLLTWLAMRWRGDAAGSGDSALKVVVAVLSFQGAALVLVRRFVRDHKTGWAEAFGFDVRWKRAALLGAVTIVLFVPMGWGLQSASAFVMERVHWPVKEQLAIEVLGVSGSLLGRFALGVAAIVIAPVAEELLFRGILYPGLKHYGFPRLALWGTAVTFGAIHVNLATFLPLTVLALVLTWLYEKTENLLAPILAHSLFNALNFVMVFVMRAGVDLPGQS